MNSPAKAKGDLCKSRTIENGARVCDPQQLDLQRGVLRLIAPRSTFAEISNAVRLITAPSVIQAAGNQPKRIEEFIGRVNSGDTALSIARMKSPAGWVEPGQTPEFDEYTLVLAGMLRVTTRSGVIEVRAGQAVVTPKGTWVQYSTPGDEGAEYLAVCLPAFSPDTVHRDDVG